MRASLRRFATPVANPTGKGNPLRPAPLNLLPPLPLYRRILRAHRRTLNADQRVMGDLYVKSEFKSHKDVDNPIHIIGFLTEWQLYAQALEGDQWKDGKMDKEKFDKMSDQQVGQLYELMQAIQNKPDDDSGNTGQP